MAPQQVLVIQVLALFLLAYSSALGITLTASLDYGVFEGSYNSQYNISYWQKIPFAAPPVGVGRFRAPQPPEPVEGIYNSTRPFSACPSRDTGSEDCLYLGLYSRPWTVGQALKPVVVNFYGGGFVYGGASLSMPPSGFPVLNVSESTDILFVHPNYRINVFGFLPGKQIAEDPESDLNVGLLDQEAALKWVKKYIAHFGGDPDAISIWGQSAGAGSVLAQMISHKHNPPLFNRALLSSPYWPKTYEYDSPEAQDLYDRMVNLTGCSGPESLSCLKNAPLATLQTANTIVVGSHMYASSQYTWAPVIDKIFLRKPLSALTPADVKGEVAFGMYNTREGDYFMPPGLREPTSSGTPPFNNSEASLDTWLRGYMPNFDQDDMEAVKRLYPAMGSTERLQYDDTFTRAGLIYRDSVLACPAFWVVGLVDDSGSGWIGEYSIPPSNHASDTAWWYLPNQVQQSDPLRYHGFTGAIASFFMTGDPNELKLTNESVRGVPSFQSGREFVIAADSFDQVEYTRLEERCDFWKRMAPKVPM
ncbi:Acetylcholinesterase [Madurella mycetomatis]|uniref:Carboxylic ester hydrolase n=1 Tax=Madurella mycetomatis TaxID=100816 RepID=A0A175VSX4_9PEZI|nr:Acetylcholinesterase [Madurella mycetomatis]